MSLKKAALWLSTLLVLGGCPEPEEKPRLSAVTVTCTPTSVVASRPSQCTAQAKDQHGDDFAVSYRWTSSDESVATVDPTGKVTTLTAGTVNISASATAGDVTQQGQATLTVTPPIVHSTPITAHETWRAADSPHVVRGSIEVSGAGNPTLTLEAGVEIHFEQDAELRITQGVLRALGTQEAPIRLLSNQRTPTKGHWRGVVFAAGGSPSELNHVTLSHCGRASGEGACLVLKNQAAPVLRHVSVQNSGTAGVVVADGNTFGTGSTTLSVSGSEGYAISVEANQAGTLPTGGTFTGNARNAVELRGSNISSSQTWPSLGIPYVVNSFLLVESGTTIPTLTLAAGTVVRFGPGAGLNVGFDFPGELILNGTQAAPILLTADAAQPQPGHWQGVHLQGESSSASRLSHVTIEYAGTPLAPGYGAGNLNIYGRPGGGSRPVINNVVVRKGKSHGVYLTELGRFSMESSVLSAHDNGGYAISVESNYAGTLPSGGTFTGNALNAVELRGSTVAESQLWPNLGIPYIVNDFLIVENEAAKPTLTLAAGTVVRFGPNGGMMVGFDFPAELVLDGTQAAPILFTADAAQPQPGHWRGVHLMSETSELSRLSHVTFEYAGTPPVVGGEDLGSGNLNIYGKYGGGGGTVRPVINNVVARRGKAAGVYMVDFGKISPGSSTLSAHDNGGYAISVESNFAGTLPSGGTFTGNAFNAVELLGGNVVESQTWPNLGIPYVINTQIIVIDSTSTTTLTLPAGTEIRFGQSASLQLGTTSLHGALSAVGTAEKPIRFIPNTATPTKGHWRGLHFWNAEGSRLDHVVVTHAGMTGSIGTGNVNVYRELGAFITRGTFSDSAGCGITVSTGSHTGSTAVTTDFTLATYNNSFTNNTGGAQCTN